MVHLVPSRLFPANRPQAWWAALKMAPPAAQGSTTRRNLAANSEIMPIQHLQVSVTLLPGAVTRIHSLLMATHLNGRVAIILS